MSFEFGSDGTGEEVTSRSRVGVHGTFHRPEHFGGFLPLIEQNRLGKSPQRRVRITSKDPGDAWRIEMDHGRRMLPSSGRLS
ncbi:hypothetical protein GCM10022221_20150 [Actinocorallia aurea]